VPPNSELEVDLTLNAIHEVTEVAPGVTKKTLRESTEWRTANEGATVTIRCGPASDIGWERHRRPATDLVAMMV
jgi:hypothetical protein